MIIIDKQIKKVLFKKIIAIKHWLYSYAYNMTFSNESIALLAGAVEYTDCTSAEG